VIATTGIVPAVAADHGAVACDINLNIVPGRDWQVDGKPECIVTSLR
jgi:hypothetical protein